MLDRSGWVTGKVSREVPAECQVHSETNPYSAAKSWCLAQGNKSVPGRHLIILKTGGMVQGMVNES